MKKKERDRVRGRRRGFGKIIAPRIASRVAIVQGIIISRNLLFLLRPSQASSALRPASVSALLLSSPEYTSFLCYVYEPRRIRSKTAPLHPPPPSLPPFCLILPRCTRHAGEINPCIPGGLKFNRKQNLSRGGHGRRRWCEESPTKRQKQEESGESERPVEPPKGEKQEEEEEDERGLARGYARLF